MALLHSVPAMLLLAAAVVLALLSRFGKAPRLTAWLSVLAASLLTLPVLAEGGTMYEALAYLLLTACLLIPREAAS